MTAPGARARWSRPALLALVLVVSRPGPLRRDFDLLMRHTPPEMTLDPSFGFNPDLENVSNQHEADFYVRCSGGWEARLRPDFGGALSALGNFAHR